MSETCNPDINNFFDVPLKNRYYFSGAVAGFNLMILYYRFSSLVSLFYRKIYQNQLLAMKTMNLIYTFFHSFYENPYALTRSAECDLEILRYSLQRILEKQGMRTFK